MKQSDYNTKVLNFVENSTGKTGSFNLKKYCALIRQYIKNSHHLIDGRSKNYILVMNHSPAVLYSLPKVHKENNPTRPTVSYVTGRITICKMFKQIASKQLEFQATHSLTNTSGLVDRLTELAVPNNPPTHAIRCD